MRYVIGIDEVGRGALAGPVVVAAVAIPGAFRAVRNKALGPLRDSKKLTPKAREAWFAHLAQNPRISYALARVYPRGVERLNISRAANLAAFRAFERLTLRHQASGGRHQVFLDGGLYIKNKAVSGTLGARTVTRGDEKIEAIAIASIIAKVSRDRFMARLARRHPAYGFEVHKGYGTAAHRAALARHGPCDAHRLTFLS
jgi:ribonuclease HII